MLSTPAFLSQLSIDVLEKPKYIILSRDETANTMSREELKYFILLKKI